MRQATGNISPNVLEVTAHEHETSHWLLGISPRRDAVLATSQGFAATAPHVSTLRRKGNRFAISTSSSRRATRFAFVLSEIVRRACNLTARAGSMSSKRASRRWCSRPKMRPDATCWARP